MNNKNGKKDNVKLKFSVYFFSVIGGGGEVVVGDALAGETKEAVSFTLGA